MPKLRTKPTKQTDAAIEELEALTAERRGISATRSGPDQVTVAVGEQTWPAKVIVRAAMSGRDAQQLIETEARGSKIVVANQLSDEAKDVLTTRNAELRSFGWSWLDRRGELHLNHPKASGIIEFGRAPATQRTNSTGSWKMAAPRSDGPIRGRAGISCAAALLLHPNAPPSIRAIAREAEMSHGAIGEASKLLREAGLVGRSGGPEIPDLFWALAAVWGASRATPVADVPTTDLAQRLKASVEGPAMSMIPGWAIGGDDAAMAWGAPMFSAGTRPWIWVPHEGDARRVERVLIPTSWEDAAAVVAVPPTSLVCLHRSWPPTNKRNLAFIPTAHPLFLAVDLAQDPARGHEILAQWHPDPARVTRVW